VQEVERQSLTAYVKPVGGAEMVPLALEADPQDGDAADKTSRFKGTLPESLQGQPVEVTIPNMRINGERFRLGFPSVIPNHVGDAMPASLGDDESRKLFLVSAGKYTAVDIAANGNQTGNQKFRGFVPTHDLKPKTGEKKGPRENSSDAGQSIRVSSASLGRCAVNRGRLASQPMYRKTSTARMAL